MSEYPEIAARFARETAHHEMTVKLDQGIYRHLRFEAPDGSGYRFDLHTSPNRLMFHGAVGTYVFSVWPTTDLFKLFTDSSVGELPNFGYWREKLVAWSEPAIQFSTDVFDKKVARELAKAEESFPGATAVWREHTEGLLTEYSTDSAEGAHEALTNFEYLPDGQRGSALRLQYMTRFVFDDYDWRYLWACHGALYGITRWNAARKAVAS